MRLTKRFALLLASATTAALMVPTFSQAEEIYGPDGASATYEPGQNGGDAPSVSAPSSTLDGPSDSVYVSGGKGGRDDGQTTNTGDGGDVTGDPTVTINGTAGEYYEYVLQGGSSPVNTAGNTTGTRGNGGDVETHITANVSGGASGILIGENGGAGTVGGNAGGITVNIDNADLDYIAIAESAGAFQDGSSHNTGVLGTVSGTNVNIENSNVKNMNIGQSGKTTDEGVKLVITNSTVDNINITSENQITVSLGNGAIVNGVITNMSGTGGILEFRMDLATNEELKAAGEAIAAAGSSGTVMIGGHEYTFKNFAELKNYLTSSEVVNNPEVPVHVSFGHGSTYEPDMPAPKPHSGFKIFCNSNAVDIGLNAQGVAEVTVKGKGLGYIANGMFVQTNDNLGWNPTKFGVSDSARTKGQQTVVLSDGQKTVACFGPKVQLALN